MKKHIYAAFALAFATCSHAGVPDVVEGVDTFVVTAPDDQTGLFVLHKREGECLFFGGAHLEQRQPHGFREGLWAAGRGERTLPNWHYAVTREACRGETGGFTPKAVDYEWDEMFPLHANDRVMLREAGKSQPE